MFLVWPDIRVRQKTTFLEKTNQGKKRNLESANKFILYKDTKLHGNRKHPSPWMAFASCASVKGCEGPKLAKSRYINLCQSLKQILLLVRG